MVSKPYLKREASKSLVSYDLSSDEYDSDADPEFVVSETESIQNDSPNIETPRARWKNVNMQNWKSKKPKKMRSECKPYTTKTGIKPAKTPKPIDCKKIPVAGRGRPHVQPYILKPAYSQQLQILEQKKKDLIKLCDTGLIPEELQNWYRNIPSRSNPQEEERAPEPEADEDSDFEEN